MTVYILSNKLVSYYIAVITSLTCLSVCPVLGPNSKRYRKPKIDVNVFANFHFHLPQKMKDEGHWKSETSQNDAYLASVLSRQPSPATSG